MVAAECQQGRLQKTIIVLFWLDMKCYTYGVVIGRVPGVDNGGMHEPDVSARFLPEGDHVLLGGPSLHAQQLVEVVGEINIGITKIVMYKFL